jgi:hypothetical protein
VLRNQVQDQNSWPLLGMSVALIYGLGGELFFKGTNNNDLLMGTLSLSFLFLLPFAIGALTVRLAPKVQRLNWSFAIFAPWAVCTALGIVVLFFALEAMICVVMGLPIYFVMSSLGGALICWWTNRRTSGTTAQVSEGGDANLLGIVLLAPLLFSPIERMWQPPTTVREVYASVVVETSAEHLWAEFVEVPKIQPHEARFAWFRAAGLPHPVEATLVNPGTNGVRYASYDNGMRVVEPVQVWEPYARYRFAVQLDPESGQGTPLWSDVAGEHLQVQWVEYRIEPLAENQVRLHLTSRYALETPLNPYAAAWTDFLLRDFQHYILDVVTARAEAH